MRKAFQNLVQLAIAECVDLVVLAGDLYDGDWPDYNTGLFFMNRMRELEREGIRVVLLTGNHDAESKITGRLTHPRNVQVLPTDRPGTARFDSLRVALHGQGYALPAETRNLAADYPAPVPGFFNVGILHTALDGRDGHAPYAPCTLGELLVRRYDYWCAGAHSSPGIGEWQQPHSRGIPRQRPGPAGAECGAKGCLLVNVRPDGSAQPEFRCLDVFRWEVVAAAATEAESPAEALDAVAQAVAEAKAQADGWPLAGAGASLVSATAAPPARRRPQAIPPRHREPSGLRCADREGQADACRRTHGRTTCGDGRRGRRIAQRPR